MQNSNLQDNNMQRVSDSELVNKDRAKTDPEYAEAVATLAMLDSKLEEKKNQPKKKATSSRKLLAYLVLALAMIFASIVWMNKSIDNATDDAKRMNSTDY